MNNSFGPSLLLSLSATTNVYLYARMHARTHTHTHTIMIQVDPPLSSNVPEVKWIHGDYIMDPLGVVRISVRILTAYNDYGS